MGRTKFTTPQMNFSKTTDANGWIVYDYGNWKEYRKRVTFSQSIAGLAVLTISSNNLPTGMSTLSTNFMNYSYNTTSNAGILSVVFEGSTSASTLVFTTYRNDGGGAATFTGFIDITLISS